MWLLTGQCPCPGRVLAPAPLSAGEAALEHEDSQVKSPPQTAGGTLRCMKPASPAWRPGPSSLPSTFSLILHTYPFLPPKALPTAPASPLPRRCQAPCSALLPLSCGTTTLPWTPRSAQLSEAPLLSALSCKPFPSLHSLPSGHSAGLVGEAPMGAVRQPRQTKVAAEVTAVLFKPFFKPSDSLSSNASFALCGSSGRKCCSQSPSQAPLSPAPLGQGSLGALLTDPWDF